MLKLQLQCFATWGKKLTHLNRPWCWERFKAGGEGDDRDEMVGWHYRLNVHWFGWTPGVGDGQGGLECCSSLCCKESDMTECLNWTVNNRTKWILRLKNYFVFPEGVMGLRTDSGPKVEWESITLPHDDSNQISFSFLFLFLFLSFGGGSRAEAKQGGRSWEFT